MVTRREQTILAALALTGAGAAATLTIVTLSPSTPVGGDVDAVVTPEFETGESILRRSRSRTRPRAASWAIGFATWPIPAGGGTWLRRVRSAVSSGAAAREGPVGIGISAPI